MSIQYMALGFEPMTFEHESPPISIRPGLPPICSTVRYRENSCKLLVPGLERSLSNSEPAQGVRVNGEFQVKYP